jgi:peptidylprolyl isomerase
VTKLRHTAIAVLALALTATACGSSDTKDSTSLRDRVHVSGSFGAKPTVTIDKSPLKVPTSTSWTTEKGDGDVVSSGATTILGLTLADGRTGKTVISTHDQGQRPLEVQLGDQVFPSLVQALVGKRAHSRVVVASSAKDAYGDQGAPQLGVKGGDPMVMVADVLSTDPTKLLSGPTGASRKAPATAPRLVEESGRPVGFDFTGLKKPKKFAAIVLRDGTGPKIEDPDRIAANYLGEVWGAKKPFDESFSKEPARFSIGLGGVIKAWDQGLSGLREGARVLLVCPPAMGYGKSAQTGIPAGSTLVFVVDVLGVG